MGHLAGWRVNQQRDPLKVKPSNFCDMNEKSSVVEPVDIELIMQEIRQKILAEHMNVGAFNEALVPLSGKRLPPQFYEHLYHAALAHNQLQIPLHVTPITIPVIGPVLAWIRTKIHLLVLFYVNQLAVQQTAVNHHLLQAISILSQELEQDDPAP